MSRASKRKGSGGELDVAKILQAHGFNARRTPRSGAWEIKGDVMGVANYTIEVKRRERLNIWEAIRQAWICATGGNIPAVVFRKNKVASDPAGEWHIAIPLDHWAAEQAELVDWRSGQRFHTYSTAYFANADRKKREREVA